MGDRTSLSNSSDSINSLKAVEEVSGTGLDFDLPLKPFIDKVFVTSVHVSITSPSASSAENKRLSANS
jgi:hypothetical protein